MKKIFFIAILIGISFLAMAGKAKAIDDAYSKVLLHFDGNDESTTFTDESGKVWTPTGTAQLDTADKKFGSASGLFDGNSDYITTPNSADFATGQNPFTIDFWVKFNSLPTGVDYQTLFSRAKAPSGITFAMIGEGEIDEIGTLSKYIIFIIGAPGSPGSYSMTSLLPTITTGVWYHFAFVRGWNGETITQNGWAICLNGARLVNVDPGQYPEYSHPDIDSLFYVGVRYLGNDAYAAYLDGAIDEFRFSNIARWTSDFTPPTTEYATTYTVTFDSQGGDPTPSPITGINYNDTVTLPTAPTKASNTFTGWNTQSNGLGTEFTAAIPVTIDVTVFAQWIPVVPETFTVTFDSNDGTPTPAPIADVISGHTVTLPAAPTKPGFAFGGWFSDDTTFLVPFTSSTPVIADVTVYAQWNVDNSLPTPQLTDITDIAKDSVKLKITVPGFLNQELDFVVKIHNADKDETDNESFIKTTNEDGKVTLTIENLDSSTDYEFSVKFSQHDLDVFSDYSNSKDATTEDDIEGDECDPTKLTASAISTSQINLNWKDNCTKEDGYNIERKTTGGTYEKIAKVNKNSEDYQNTKLLPETTYTYRVRGYDGSRFSNYSNNATATTLKQSIIIIEKLPVIPEEPSVIPPESPVISPEPEPEPTPPKELTPKKPIPTPQEELKETFIENMETPAVQEISVVMEIVGLLTGASVVLAATSIPLFPLSPTPFTDFFSKFFSIFGLLGRSSKKKNDFGFVFDAETRRPIAGAKISILSAEGKVAESILTDSAGRYGFLAKDGMYFLQISKKGYALKQDNRQDEFYGSLYTGGLVEIRQNEMLKTSLAMQALDINWQDFAERKIAAYTSLFSVIKKDFFIIIFYVGFLAAIAIMYFSPTILNGIVIAVYAIIAVYHIFFKTKSFGIISNRLNKPVPFSMVSLYAENNPDRRIAFAVSDVLGRYYLLVEDGFYNLKVQGQELIGNTFSKTMRVYAKKGIIKEDVVVG